PAAQPSRYKTSGFVACQHAIRTGKYATANAHRLAFLDPPALPPCRGGHQRLSTLSGSPAFRTRKPLLWPASVTFTHGASLSDSSRDRRQAAGGVATATGGVCLVPVETSTCPEKSAGELCNAG